MFDTPGSRKFDQIGYNSTLEKFLKSFKGRESRGRRHDPIITKSRHSSARQRNAILKNDVSLGADDGLILNTGLVDS